ncbi:helix-hairpin-helix domain-containing protein [Streptomyces cylindrosporus]|uniref:ATP-binding domain-containing protein n=1 Tax=Streptomyces cylindrosporus TaxID=2927583 RepID=A0ABS9YEQ0_9ACTN|nr:helix-hairpin-helix domain-containing protein [Streptomyces cylindrosporus]MCI3275713.1 ATP-binding domain-containing protein [Streptomyces cylindrosporus]
MSTDPETTEPTEPGTPGTATEGNAAETAAGRGAEEADGAGKATGEDEAASLAADGGAEPEASGGEGAGAGAEGVSAGYASEAARAEDAGADSSGEPVGAGDAGAGSAGEAARAGSAGEAVGVGVGGEGAAVGQLSEAAAELAAQQVERERIKRRKAEKAGPIASGAKLSGKAADLLAAVRAVESGAKPTATVFDDPTPAPRRPAPEPVRRPQPTPEPAAPVAAPAAEAVDAVRRVLADGGAPDAFAPQVAAALGEGADEQLREDPWQLLRVTGVRPEQADGFARALLGAEAGPDDERRGRALTGWLLEQAAVAGHTALEMQTLTAALGRQGVPDAESAVQSAVTEGEALVFQDALDPRAPQPEEDEEGETEEQPVRILVGLERYALAEESLADGLARLINSVPKEDGSAEGWERAAARAKGSTAELIRAVAGHGLVLHTGGEASLTEPATLLRAATALGLSAWAAAHTPSGRTRFAARFDAQEDSTSTDSPRATSADSPRAASANSSRATSTDAPPPTSTDAPPPTSVGTQPVATVAGLLSGVEGPGRDADGALDLDLLVVLDAPQLDVETAALLVESLRDGARLVLVGDPAVLWSAGPGRVFADLLAARVSPHVASRVPDLGPLGELVSGIGIGELNQVDAPGKEVVIVPVRDAGEAVHRTVQLVADSVPRAIGVPADQTQVITPAHGGAAGTRALNAALKERLNPGPGRFAGFDPGDRVAYSPTLGRTVPGQVVKADAEGLHLSCAGTPVVVPKDRVEQSVRHGWALTAHQAAGTRWPAAVVVLPGDAAQSLTRPWVYTAFSRADRHLSVVHGADQALQRAVTEIPAKPRTTRLPVLLATQLPTTT